MQFKDRFDAGKKLTKLLEKFKGKDTVLYALPRGGVEVGSEIAREFNIPMDLIITRKISHPYQKEYAIGAVAENGEPIYNKEAISGISEEYLAFEAEKQRQEAKRRREVYLKGRKSIPCRGKIAILVDDGIATGLTLKAAVRQLKLHYHPKKIIAAVPVAPLEIVRELEAEGVEVIALEIPEYFQGAVGSYYESFPAVSDEEVIRLL